MTLSINVFFLITDLISEKSFLLISISLFFKEGLSIIASYNKFPFTKGIISLSVELLSV